MTPKYQLRMNISITQVDERGSYMAAANNLQVTEDIYFEADSFTAVAHILGQFHELGNKIKVT